MWANVCLTQRKSIQSSSLLNTQKSNISASHGPRCTDLAGKYQCLKFIEREVWGHFPTAPSGCTALLVLDWNVLNNTGLTLRFGRLNRRPEWGSRVLCLMTAHVIVTLPAEVRFGVTPRDIWTAWEWSQGSCSSVKSLYRRKWMKFRYQIIGVMQFKLHIW